MKTHNQSFKSILWALPLVILSACGTQKNIDSQIHAQGTEGILNGDQVTGSEGFVKHVVGLGMSDSRGTLQGIFCTGVLISSNLVLTAAHCISEGLEGAVIVFEHNLMSAKILRAAVIEGGLMHPKYGLPSSGDQYDLAVVKFRGSAPQGYSPARITSTPSSLKKGGSVLLSGWGWVDAATRRSPTALRKVTVPVVQVTSTEITLDQSQGGACHGDSGGPAFIRVQGEDILVGITSRADGGPEAGVTCAERSIYTQVGPFSAWIESASKDLAPNSFGSEYDDYKSSDYDFGFGT